jgi:hypothetical protein
MLTICMYCHREKIGTETNANGDTWGIYAHGPAREYSAGTAISHGLCRECDAVVFSDEAIARMDARA